MIWWMSALSAHDHDVLALLLASANSRQAKRSLLICLLPHWPVLVRVSTGTRSPTLQISFPGLPERLSGNRGGAALIPTAVRQKPAPITAWARQPAAKQESNARWKRETSGQHRRSRRQTASHTESENCPSDSRLILSPKSRIACTRCPEAAPSHVTPVAEISAAALPAVTCLFPAQRFFLPGACPLCLLTETRAARGTKARAEVAGEDELAADAHPFAAGLSAGGILHSVGANSPCSCKDVHQVVWNTVQHAAGTALLAAWHGSHPALDFPLQLYRLRNQRASLKTVRPCPLE